MENKIPVIDYVILALQSTLSMTLGLPAHSSMKAREIRAGLVASLEAQIAEFKQMRGE